MQEDYGFMIQRQRVQLALWNKQHCNEKYKRFQLNKGNQYSGDLRKGHYPNKPSSWRRYTLPLGFGIKSQLLRKKAERDRYYGYC